MATSIYGMVYNELQAKIKHLPEYNTKIAHSVFNKLDREAIGDIILDDKVFWFEHRTYETGLTNREYNWLIKYLRGHGYNYLYDRLPY